MAKTASFGVNILTYRTQQGVFGGSWPREKLLVGYERLASANFLMKWHLAPFTDTFTLIAGLSDCPDDSCISCHPIHWLNFQPEHLRLLLIAHHNNITTSHGIRCRCQQNFYFKWVFALPPSCVNIKHQPNPLHPPATIITLWKMHNV